MAINNLNRETRNLSLLLDDGDLYTYDYSVTSNFSDKQFSLLNSDSET